MAIVVDEVARGRDMVAVILCDAGRATSVLCVCVCGERVVS